MKSSWEHGQPSRRKGFFDLLEEFEFYTKGEGKYGWVLSKGIEDEGNII